MPLQSPRALQYWRSRPAAEPARLLQKSPKQWSSSSAYCRDALHQRKRGNCDHHLAHRAAENANRLRGSTGFLVTRDQRSHSGIRKIECGIYDRVYKVIGNENINCLHHHRAHLPEQRTVATNVTAYGTAIHRIHGLALPYFDFVRSVMKPMMISETPSKHAGDQKNDTNHRGADAYIIGIKECEQCAAQTVYNVTCRIA